MSEMQSVFIEEANELLTELETALLELEESPDDGELIGRVFRAMHTIKGSGSMFGFEDIAAFTHDLETAFDLVREGRMRVTPELINLSLSAKDEIKQMLDAFVAGQAHDHGQCARILAALKKVVPQEDGWEDASDEAEPPASDFTGENPPLAFSIADSPAASGESEAVPQPSAEVTYRIRFEPEPDLFATGTNPLLLLDELRELGPCDILAQAERVPVLEEMDPESCYTYWDIVLTTDQGMNAIKDVFIFVEDQCRIHIQEIDEGDGQLEKEGHKRLGDILVERGDLTSEAVEKAVTAQKRVGEILIDAEAVGPGQVASALLEQDHVKKRRQVRNTGSQASSLRVAAAKLDSLVDLVGELVTVQARLSQKAAVTDDPDLMDISEVVERLTAELRDNTMSIRMMPIGTTFSKLKRLVRDLSRELRKDVIIVTDGGETELDKTVIEKLSDPLVHIIRNCIDHGIEDPEQRSSAGKPHQGTVRIVAEHSGANVLIHISDDGAGLNAERIRRKAAGNGMISPEASLTDKEVHSLIFSPGFSTTDTVTSVSGRGVGMDVVKESVESLRGSVEVMSREGEGTTFTLKLPLTLAIIDGLLVEIDKDKYVLPLSAIEECVALSREDAAKTHGRNILNIRGEIVPYIQLRERFDITGDSPDMEQIVINNINGQRIGIVVDRVIGEHQIVIKTMSKLYENISEVSGATILGDGTVALILDVSRLMETALPVKQKAA